MMMSLEDKAIVRRNAIFLEEKGYVMQENDYGLKYENSDYAFAVFSGRYDEPSDVLIRFKQGNESFSVGWIAKVRGALIGKHKNMLDELLDLISYTKENYDKVTDVDFCRESQAMIHDYLVKLGAARE